MRPLSLFLAAVLVASCATPTVRVEPAPASPSVAVVDPAPARGSDQDKADLAIVLWMQRTRSSADVARARDHLQVNLATFATALGDRFDVAAHPRTQALLDRFVARSHAVSGEAKRRWARPRPYVADARVAPAVKLEDTFSYPSGHAIRGVLLARILGELAISRRAELLEIGLQVGYDRVVGGVHYPSDVLGGQRLGEALATALLASPDLSAEVEAVRAAEWPARERAAAAGR